MLRSGTFINLDGWGALASGLCAAHCLLMPLLATVAPYVAWGAYPPADATPAEVCCSETAKSCETAAAASTTEAEASAAACCDDPSAFWIHAGMLSLTLPLAGFALFSGYTCHRQLAGVAAGGTGLLLLSTALPLHSLAPAAAFWCNVCGSALLVSAHLWNWRRCACQAGCATAGAMVAGTTASAAR